MNNRTRILYCWKDTNNNLILQSKIIINTIHLNHNQEVVQNMTCSKTNADEWIKYIVLQAINLKSYAISGNTDDMLASKAPIVWTLVMDKGEIPFIIMGNNEIPSIIMDKTEIPS